MSERLGWRPEEVRAMTIDDVLDAHDLLDMYVELDRMANPEVS